MSDAPKPAPRFRSISDPALVALLLASLVAAVLNYCLIVFSGALLAHASIGVAIGTLGQALLNGWAIILTLMPVWIIVLLITRLVVVRIWPPTRIWKSMMVASVGTMAIAVFWGLLGAMVAFGVAGAFTALGHALTNAQWWLVLALRAVIAVAAVGAQADFKRLLKAEHQP